MRWYRFRSRQIQSHERVEEMRAHLELYAEELVARGWSPDDARRQARLKFGNPRVKLEELEAMNRIPLIETLGQDLRAAFRGLRAAPAFTAVVLAVLTLAMGATTAVFSVVDAVVLRGLPFDEGDRLVALDRTVSGRVMMTSFPAPQFLALRAQPDVFDGLAAVTDRNVILRRDHEHAPEILRAQRVTAEFFPVLRVTPAIGRAFTIENEAEGRDRVAVISHGLWQRRFGGASDILGKRLPAAAGDVEILGVMPPGFAYPIGAVQPTELWMPYVIPNRERVENVAAYLRLVARLKEGVTLESTQARIDRIATSSAAFEHAAGRDALPTLRNLHESLTGYTRPWMLMLLGSVACVLLIACVNVANLLLVRATVRVRELSVRSALGATRWDLARMLLTESLVLSTFGTALGVLAAWSGIETLRSLLPSSLPRLANIAIDLRVFAVAATAAFITGIAFGLAPVVHCSGAIDHALRENGRTDTASSRRQWLRSTFLVAEVALAVVLLVGTALFLTSFAKLMRIDVGLDYRNVLVVDVHPRPAASNAGGTEARKGNDARLANLLEQVRAIPGVEAASMATDNLPFSLTRASRMIRVPGRDLTSEAAVVHSSHLSPDYFRTLGVPILRGRSFTAADVQGSELVVILNETAAKMYFPDRDPVGRIVSLDQPRTIVGVVGDVRSFGPEGNVQPESYVPMAQAQVAGGTLVVKTAGNNAVIVPQVKAAIWSVFPDFAIPAPRTLEEGFGVLIAERRFSMVLLGVFGFFGVTIASVGIYGVMTYVVTQRTREIGIRMALGALASTILWSVLRRASIQLALGLLAGLGMAWFLATSVERFLFRVEPHDPGLYAAACGVLASTALAAAFFPARLAARVDPLVALRSE